MAIVLQDDGGAEAEAHQGPPAQCQARMHQVRQGASRCWEEEGPPEEVQARGPGRVGDVAGMRENEEIGQQGDGYLRHMEVWPGVVRTSGPSRTVESNARVLIINSIISLSKCEQERHVLIAY